MKTYALNPDIILDIQDTNNDNKLYDDFLNMPNEDIAKMNGGKKFDICLMNPPYDNGLHLSFLKKVSEISNKIVSIQPCNWLFLKSKQKRTKDVRDLVDKYYTECDVYDGELTAKLFDNVGPKTNISINFIDTTKEDNALLIDGLRGCQATSNYTSIDDVKLFGQDPIWNSLFKKIIANGEDKLESHACVYKDLPRVIAYFQKVGRAVERGTHEFDGKWIVNHGTLANHIGSDDFYTGMYKGSKFIMPQKFEDVAGELKVFYVFDTEQEAQNMIDYFKTDFFRTAIFLTKLGGVKIVADICNSWQDFTQHWDDEKLFKKYDITKEEQKRIREVLPDYYGIRK